MIEEPLALKVIRPTDNWSVRTTFFFSLGLMLSSYFVGRVLAKVESFWDSEVAIVVGALLVWMLVFSFVVAVVSGVYGVALLVRSVLGRSADDGR